MLSKGYACHLVGVEDIEQEVFFIDFVSVVNMGFDKKGKLSLRYIGHYEILQEVSIITKRLGFCSSCVSHFDS